MRLNYTCVLLLTVFSTLLVGKSKAAQADEQPRLSVTIANEISWPALDTARASIDTWQEMFGFAPSETQATSGLMGSVDLRLRKKMWIGVRVSLQAQKLAASRGGTAPAVRELQFEYRLTSLDVGMRHHFQESFGLYFGARLGLAFARFAETVFLSTAYLPEGAIDRNAHYSGTALTAGGVCGYQAPVFRHLSLDGEIGYVFRALPGLHAHAESGGDDIPATDHAGNAIDFDFSGFRCSVGLSVGF